MGLYTPTILGRNSYLSWFYDRGAIKDPAHTGTSKRLSQAINGGPIRKFLPKYANVYVTIQSHGLSAGAQTHYVTANGVRNGLRALTDSLPPYRPLYVGQISTQCWASPDLCIKLYIQWSSIIHWGLTLYLLLAFLLLLECQELSHQWRIHPFTTHLLLMTPPSSW